MQSYTKKGDWNPRSPKYGLELSMAHLLFYRIEISDSKGIFLPSCVWVRMFITSHLFAVCGKAPNGMAPNSQMSNEQRQQTRHTCSVNEPTSDWEVTLQPLSFHRISTFLWKPPQGGAIENTHRRHLTVEAEISSHDMLTWAIFLDLTIWGALLSNWSCWVSTESS